MNTKIKINTNMNRPDVKKIIKVSGCPGAGKTTWIINKIKEMIESGINPEEIFLISFSKASVKTLQDRLKPLGIEQIRTLHSIAYRYIKGFSRRKLLFNDKYLMKKCDINVYFIGNKLNRNCPSFEGNEEFNNYNYIIYNEWLKYRDYNIIFDNIIELCKKKNLLMETIKEKIENGIIDFNDLIIHTFEDEPTIKMIYGNKIKYIFIDEAQDFTELEFALVNKLIKGIDTVYFVGDEDQTIYGFKGANVSNFYSLKYDEIIYLNKSYRCPEKIMKIAINVRNKIEMKDENKKITWVKEGGEVKYINLKSKDKISKYIINKYEFLKKKPIYVLCRKNKDVFKISLELLLNGYNVASIKPNSPVISEVKILFNLLIKLKNNEKLKSEEFYNMIKFIQTSKYDNSREKFNKMLNYLINDLYKYSEESNIGKDTIDLLKNIDKIKIKYSTIFIDTIHSVKGMEFENVLLFDIYSNIDMEKITLSQNLIDDELRLMYVGITRSMKNLEIITSKDNESILKEIGVL